jgi:hypothetical protein
MGSATILAGNTYVDVAHCLSYTPTIDQIEITPQDDLGGRGFWPSNPTSTTFRINISMADPDTNHTFGWQPIVPAPPTPAPSAPSLGVFISVNDIQSQLNAAYDSSSLVYTVFGLPVSQASFQAHVNFANTYILNIIGPGVDPTSSRYQTAVLAAMDIACIRILVASLGGSLVGAFDYFIGDMRVARAGPYATAIKEALQGFHDDLLRVLMNLSTSVIAAEGSAKDDVPTYKGGLMNP